MFNGACRPGCGRPRRRRELVESKPVSPAPAAGGVPNTGSWPIRLGVLTAGGRAGLVGVVASPAASSMLARSAAGACADARPGGETASATLASATRHDGRRRGTCGTSRPAAWRAYG